MFSDFIYTRDFSIFVIKHSGYSGQFFLKETAWRKKYMPENQIQETISSAIIRFKREYGILQVVSKTKAWRLEMNEQRTSNSYQ